MEIHDINKNMNHQLIGVESTITGADLSKQTFQNKKNSIIREEPKSSKFTVTSNSRFSKVSHLKSPPVMFFHTELNQNSLDDLN
jgi:hypothetical protein